VAHFHPSVSLFASRLLNGKEMPAKPDLASHTLIHFLDRFVYRNAKVAAGSLRGNSIMQPLAGGEGRDVLISKRLIQRQHEPLNSDSFWRKKADDVAVDEVFFHKYFNHIAKGKKPTRQKLKPLENAEATDGDEDDGENEDEIWQALVESRPEVEGHSEDDSDLEMLNLDDSEDDSPLGDGVDLEVDEEDGGSEGFDVDALQGIDSNVSSNDGKDGSLEMEELFGDELNKDDHVGNTTKGIQKNKSKRRKLKHLPIFASTEEYAEMLEDDDNMD
jgi:ribosome biogenesis protein MAK21